MAVVVADGQNVNNEKFFPVLPIDTTSRLIMVFFPSSASYTNSQGQNRHVYNLMSVNVKYSAALDEKMDDGKPFNIDSYASGEIFPDGTGECEMDDDPTSYDVTNSSRECNLIIRAGF